MKPPTRRLAVQKKEKVCKWKYDEAYDFWDTACEESFCLIEGTLKDNKMKYCPYCGGRIKATEEIQ